MSLVALIYVSWQVVTFRLTPPRVVICPPPSPRLLNVCGVEQSDFRDSSTLCLWSLDPLWAEGEEGKISVEVIVDSVESWWWYLFTGQSGNWPNIFFAKRKGHKWGGISDRWKPTASLNKIISQQLQLWWSRRCKEDLLQECYSEFGSNKEKKKDCWQGF